MISVKRKVTTKTMIHTIRQLELLPCSTIGTVLTCVGGVDLNHSFTSIFCFIFEKVKKHSPCGISNTFINTAKIILFHIVNRKIFNTYSIKSIYKFTRFLMRKIMSLIRNSFMHTSNYLASFCSGFRCLFLFRKFALNFGKIFFFFPEKARVLNVFAVGKGCEMLQAHIQTNRWFDWLLGRDTLNITGKSYKPFSSSCMFDGAGFNHAFDRPMKLDLNTADFRKSDNIFEKFEATLRIGEAIVPELAPKSWVAGLFAGLDSAKERPESQINPGGNILKRLAKSIGEEWVLFLKAGNCFALIPPRKVFLFGLPTVFALLKKIIIEPSTCIKRMVEPLRLSFIWENPIFKSFSHEYYTIRIALCNVNTYFNRKERQFIPGASPWGILAG